MAARKKKATTRKAKTKPRPRRIGRPSKFTQAVAEEICTRLELGETLIGICKDDAMPALATVGRWRRGKGGADSSFGADYARARELQQDYWADLIIEKTSALTTLCESESVDHARVQALRLEIDSRRWLMSRLARHVYGDRQQHLEHTGKDGGPVKVVYEGDWGMLTGGSDDEIEDDQGEA